MEEGLAKLDQSSLSPERNRPIPYDDHDPMQLALNNPIILESVFKHLAQPSLKYCRKVCSTWSQISESLIHPPTVIKLEYDDKCGFGGLESSENESILRHLNRITALPEDRYDRRFDLQAVVEPVLNQIWDLKKTPQLKFCVWPISFNLWPEEIREDARKLGAIDLINFIKHASHLQVLDIWNHGLPRSFWNGLLGPEDLAGNPTLKDSLVSLSIVKPRKIDVEALRKKKLNTLKILIVEVPEAERQEDYLRELSLWLRELSSTLEYLFLAKEHPNFFRRPVVGLTEFLTGMKLKTVRIDRPAFYGVVDIIPLLKRLPTLQSLTLMHAASTGVKQEDYMADAFDDFTHPSLKEFKIDTYRFDELECPTYSYVPELFPNLRKLSISVYSKNFFLACIYALKETMIEELELTLNSLPTKYARNDVAPCFPTWASKFPSLNAWKKLRKLSLRSTMCYYYQDARPRPPDSCSVRKIYGMLMEKILPKRLTSLELDSLGRVEFDYLLKLLEGLPLLMDLKLEQDSVLDENGRLMRLPVLRDQIGKNPLVNHYLHVRFDCFE